MNQPSAQQKGRDYAPSPSQKPQADHSVSFRQAQPPFIGVHGLLQRLDRVKQTKPGHWTARCPAREDKTPSLSVRELDDGRVLLHDFGGSDYFDILAAVGIAPIELVPENLRHARQAYQGKAPPPVPCMDAVRAIAFQASVVHVAAAMVTSGEVLSEHDLDQLARAVRIIDSALAAVGVTS